MLDEHQSRLVLNWAVALVLAGDKDGLDEVSRRFSGRFAGGDYGALFKAVAGAGDSPSVDFRGLAKQVADLDTLRAFMAGYRATQGKPVLSAVE